MPLAAFTSAERLFAPSADLWPRWEQHDPASEAVIDFTAWDAFLKAHVQVGDDGVHRLDYGRLAADEGDSLAQIVADLAAVPISTYGRREQFAYWVNLYNAVTIKLIADHYPVESIRDVDISPGLFASGPWDKDLVTVEGEELTLNDIEHRILRPIWNDPRIHYAVNCASIGCPNLALDAFTGADLEKQLEAAARSYINDPRGVTVANGEVTVSKIYDWFFEDFGESVSLLLQHLKSYAEPALAAQLEDIGTINGTAYDWNLNGTGSAAGG
ncbi:MAG TPA: DUF547 domain-containing protein [Kiloniellaceae bacterium]|nr:DUF547 domain-containing protein [Kiloniellaceae bacterium]HIP77557.1 DUF547 domain-containing protein [Kiloniellaceae bacterium]